ncbi:MAG TPA: hypothetical protein VL172_06985, partial [Kofleriaceae bacterium]|nr:hypothetical protein [Kofleriaceae bacterium]
MTEAPRVLLVTSQGSSPASVVPVLAAVECAGLRLRAIDVGRVGARSEGTVERMIRAVFGEIAERRLGRELNSNPPDVVVAFDPGAAQALTVARDSAQRPAPVVGVIDDLQPMKEWAATDADRFLVVDDEAAVALADHGVEADRIVAVGPIAPAGYPDAGRQTRESLRARFKIAGRAVVLVEVAGLGYDVTSQLSLQLSLTDADADVTYLFDAGTDSDAATALRRQVPTLGLRAKLFGRSPEAPLYWRCADVVVARPRGDAVARALAVGARMVCFGSDDRTGEALTRALEARGLATAAA